MFIHRGGALGTHENVVVVAVVALIDAGLLDDFRAMRLEIRGLTPLRRPNPEIVEPQIVRISSTAADFCDMLAGQQQVVVHEEGAVIDFEHHILAVVVQEIASDASALAHPIQPDATPVGAIVDMVVPNHHIHSAMHLDARRFASPVVVVFSDIMDFISFDGRENASHTPNESRLTAVVDVVVPNDMMPHGLARPTRLQREFNRCAHVVLVVHLVAGFAQRDSNAG